MMFCNSAFLSYFWKLDSLFVINGFVKSALTADETTSGTFWMLTS